MLAKLIRSVAKETGKATVELAVAPLTAVDAAIKSVEKRSR